MKGLLVLLKTRLSLQVVIVLIPFLALVGMVVQNAVNVPVTDQYEMIPLFQKVDAGTLGFSDLWAQHNEHRIFFPRTVLLGLALLTGWSMYAEIAAILVFAASGFAAIFMALRRMPLAEPIRLLLLFVASLWFFSPIQYENWIWGWQLEWYMCSAAILWTLYLLSRIRSQSVLPHALIGAAITAVVATYSLGSGPLVWLIGLVVLVLQATRRWQQYVFWAVAGALSIAVYYIGYHSPGKPPELATFIHEPATFAEIYLAYLGRPAFGGETAAIQFGTALLMIFIATMIYMLWRRRPLLKRYSVMIGLVLFVLLTDAATTLSRFDYGLVGGMSSRYTAFSVLFVIGVTVLMVGVLTPPKFHRRMHAILATAGLALLFAPLVWNSYRNGIIGLQQRSKQFTMIKECSQVPEPTYKCLYEIYFPSTVEAKARLDYLKQKDYGGY